MTAKEYLDSYGSALEKKKRIEDDIRRIEAEIGMPAINYDGMPRGNKISKPTEQSAIRIAGEVKKLLDSKENAIKTMLEVEETIDKLNNPMERKVLRARYIGLKENGTNKEWWKIANELGYSEEGVYRLHRVALRHIHKIIRTMQSNEV